MSRPMLMLDLFCGYGGASAAMAQRGWEVVRVDILRSLGTPVVADLREWSWGGATPDLVWASPPCQEFSRHTMPWTRKKMPGPPSMELVEAARRIIKECSPRWWVIENVRGAVPYLGRPVARFGAYCLWGKFPAFEAKAEKRKESWHSSKKQHRAMVPYAISLGLALACEREPTWVPCPCCENYQCLLHKMARP